ncbi:MAG: hypothetical protein K9M75_11010 [Phycisphaerae bacterium]|nr:hypothetical protein [Phycisphaerae bacterium]
MEGTDDHLVVRAFFWLKMGVLDIVDISHLWFLGVLGRKYGSKTVKNLHFFAFLRAFWSLLRVFELFLSVKNCGN